MICSLLPVKIPSEIAYGYTFSCHSFSELSCHPINVTGPCQPVSHMYYRLLSQFAHCKLKHIATTKHRVDENDIFLSYCIWQLIRRSYDNELWDCAGGWIRRRDEQTVIMRGHSCCHEKMLLSSWDYTCLQNLALYFAFSFAMSFVCLIHQNVRPLIHKFNCLQRGETFKLLTKHGIRVILVSICRFLKHVFGHLTATLLKSFLFRLLEADHVFVPFICLYSV